jgi:DNA replication protein DnaC
MARQDCPICHGTGFRIVVKEELSGAERCECQIADRTRVNEEQARIPPLYRNASLENFALPRDNPIAERGLREVMGKVKGFTREFPTEKTPGLMLMGAPGSGKTHLAVAALRRLIDRGFEGIFFDYQNLLDRIRAGFNQAAGAADKEAYRDALDAEVLLLDDLGAHRVTDWVEDTVTSIITYRCNNRKPTMVTTNLIDLSTGPGPRPASPGGRVDYRDTLEDRIGSRARSRLFEMCRVVRMPLVDDFRMRKPAQ